MASACLLTKSHLSLHCLARSRNSQRINAIAHKRRLVGVLRCAAAEQTTLQILTAAEERAALRAVESSREEPLFHDPYAVCLAATKGQALNVVPAAGVNGNDVGYYELATSFIDERLLEAVKDDQATPVRQIVLLTDGMDTRPYRLPWPPASMIFDVSPNTTFNIAVERLEAVGARIRRGCMFRHVSVDLSDDGDWKDESLERKLVSVGYQGIRPSVWAMQGLQTLTAEGLYVILRCIGSLAAKDSIFLGELPRTALGDISQDEIVAALYRVFGSNGFHVSLMPHNEISCSAWSKSRPLAVKTEEGYGEVFFVAKQLKLSDQQVDLFQTMISDREEIDEDGFEDW
nr:hypothetical protein PHYPA_028972 [Physcomitrium patens]